MNNESGGAWNVAVRYILKLIFGQFKWESGAQDSNARRDNLKSNLTLFVKKIMFLCVIYSKRQV